MKKPIGRSRHGNILVLGLAILLGILLVFVLFALAYTRLIGVHHEQKTAIEAAALAAARDLSRIVIEDPYFGFVGLSDAAPIGTHTKAGDNYFLHAQSINTILATIRLDMIIADLLNNNIMRSCAQRDYQLALTAKDNLLTALNQAVLSTGSGTDINGQTVQPVADAIAEYQKNIIRMSGRASTLDAASLKLTLGWIDGLDTNSSIPHPSSSAFLVASQQDNNSYKAFLDIPYKSYDFVFAAADNDVTLVDFRNFRIDNGGLPYNIPDIVKCEADEVVTYQDEHTQLQTERFHTAACAQPACLIDTRPTPGALCLTFPQGRPPEISKLSDILLNDQVTKSPADWVQTPTADDYPPAPLNEVTLPIVSSAHPPLGEIISLAVYDWLRRAGTAPDLTSLMNNFNNAFAGLSMNSPQKIFFAVSQTGTTTATALPDDPTQALATSQNQYRVIGGDALESDPNGTLSTTGNATDYDVIVKDYTFQPGRISGGKHAGEPFGASTGTVPPPPPQGPMDEAPTAFQVFPLGPPAGAKRPTYQSTTSTAVEITFRVRVPPPTGSSN